MNNELLDTNLAQSELEITKELQSYFQETSKWAKIIAIIGFIILAIIMIGGIIMTASMIKLNQDMPPGMGGMEGMGDMGGMGAMGYMGYMGTIGIFVGLFYLVMGLIYFFPTLYTFRFAKNLKLAHENNDQEAYAKGFKNLKSCFKFFGIMTIVSIVFYFLSIGAGIFFGLGDFIENINQMSSY